MYKIRLVAQDDSNISHKISIHPYLLTNGDEEKTVWNFSKCVRKRINEEEINLVDIPAEVLNNLARDDNYYVYKIDLKFAYDRGIDLKQRILIFDVLTFHRDNCKLKGYTYKSWDDSVKRYMKLKKKYHQLQQALLHETYRPGGSGYEKAKADFEQQIN